MAQLMTAIALFCQTYSGDAPERRACMKKILACGRTEVVLSETPTSRMTMSIPTEDANNQVWICMKNFANNKQE